MKVLDLISSTSGSTFDKAINITYNLYTSIKNDAVVISYGDSSQQTLNLNSSKEKYLTITLANETIELNIQR